MRKTIALALLNLVSVTAVLAFPHHRNYELWYDHPAPNGGARDSIVMSGFPYDGDWERWSLPIGNGYMGATVFGRTDTERIQLSEKTLANRGCYNNGGFTSFAEIYLDFNHAGVSDYRRSLSLNDAMAAVTYKADGAVYEREYFANYPSNVIAVKIKSDARGKVSLAVRPAIPYLNNARPGDNRTGRVYAKGDLITLSGLMEHFGVEYEAQLKVVNYGGSLVPVNDGQGDHGQIRVEQADSVVLFLAAGTSYRLDERVFLLSGKAKCAGNAAPHAAVSERIGRAVKMGYEGIREEHLADYHRLFDRVQLELSDEVPALPVDELLGNYKKGMHHPYLEELYFHYGRYLLIASSREKSLPANLQGGWTQYDYSPWSGGYWHNINVQMNYWPAFNTNLAELFEPFVAYTEAYRKGALENASNYIRKNNPAMYSEGPGANGWTIGTNATAYGISEPGQHSGPGTGGFTTKLYWDYYDFTRDREVLEEHVYPALEGMARFLSKTLKPDGEGHLLVDPSFSPENMHNGVAYQTVGCAFDQGMIWENFNDLLHAAEILGKESPLLDTIRYQIGKLDPVLIGKSGQLKEYREEEFYGDIGERNHRHISHLCLLYPGTLINSTSPAWMDAARKALEGRGVSAGMWVGWPLAHRMNCWARLKDGETAYRFYLSLLEKGVFENLWGNCPPFQIDSNFGATSGVAEMLLQSHEGYIDLLPALPACWKDGFYNGLVARGNFVVDVAWKDNRLHALKIHSRSGGDCVVHCAGTLPAGVVGPDGNRIRLEKLEGGKVKFATQKGQTYTFVL